MDEVKNDEVLNNNEKTPTTENEQNSLKNDSPKITKTNGITKKNSKKAVKLQEEVKVVKVYSEIAQRAIEKSQKSTKAKEKKKADSQKNTSEKSLKTKTNSTKKPSAKKTTKGAKKPVIKEEPTGHLTQGIINPIEYYYSVAQSKTRAIEYVEVVQYLNDKFNGRITQAQFFHIAEQSKRIFQLNRLAIEHAKDCSVVNPKIKFLIQISTKWFSSKVKIETLMGLISTMKDNIILCFDAVGLVKEGLRAKEAYKRIVKDYRMRILLDNAENQNLAMLIGFHPDYVRLDARNIDKSNENYTDTIKFFRGYFAAQHIKMGFKYVPDSVHENYFINNGADFLEGVGIYQPKKLLQTVLKDYKII